MAQKVTARGGGRVHGGQEPERPAHARAGRVGSAKGGGGGARQGGWRRRGQTQAVRRFQRPQLRPEHGHAIQEKVQGVRQLRRRERG